MSRAYNIFGDIEGKLTMLHVECTRCSRKGRYNVQAHCAVRTPRKYDQVDVRSKGRPSEPKTPFEPAMLHVAAMARLTELQRLLRAA